MQDKTTFKKLLPKYDYELIESLLNAFNQGEGSIFNWSQEEYNSGLHAKQIEFHEKILNQIKPKYILETGTHKANYCYLAKVNVPDVKICTFGIDPENKICVDILNKHFNQDYIKFTEGNSVKTLSDEKSDVCFDLAWIDVALSDLNNCKRLGIKKILIDDTSFPEVFDAVKTFVSSSNYEIKDKSECNRQVLLLVEK